MEKDKKKVEEKLLEDLDEEPEFVDRRIVVNLHE